MATSPMNSLIDNVDVWRNFIFPFLDTAATVSVACYAVRQYKIERLHLAERFLERLNKIVACYNNLRLLTLQLNGNTPEWQAGYKECKEALKDLELAAILYKKVNELSHTTQIYNQGIELMLKLVVLPEMDLHSGARRPLTKSVLDRLQDLEDNKSLLYAAIAAEFNIDKALQSL